jgi:hypothetical protein
MFAHSSIADIPEDQLVEYLLSAAYWRSTLIGIYGLPGNLIDKQRVLLHTVPGRDFRGDADILLSGPGQHEQTVAYQVKRIKVGMSQLRYSAPSKLEELKVAVRQANLLAEVGFWKVFLYVITVVDAREQNLLEDRALFNEIKYKIGLAISNSIGNLNQRVGVFDIELIQSTDNRRYTAQKADLLKISQDCRIAIEEFLHLAGLIT